VPQNNGRTDVTPSAQRNETEMKLKQNSFETKAKTKC